MLLTTMDVHQLIKNPSSVPRDTLAEKVVVAFTSGGLSASEASIAADIFRILLRDAEKSIRQTLADYLYEDALAPRDVVFKLACDESTDISEKILEHSPVLTDDDLIAVINSTKEVLNLCAIARRAGVSEKLSDALIDSGQESVLRDLFGNKGAKIAENSFSRAWEMIEGSNSLLEVLVKRGGLPLTIADKLFTVVSGSLRDKLVKDYNISGAIADKAIADVREWELLGIAPVPGIEHPDDDEKIEELVKQLHVSGRLTYSLIVRSLCMGFLNLFEAGLAHMADIPRANARILLMGGSEGFRALYTAADMPEGFAAAVEKLLAISHSLTKFGHEKPQEFRKRMIERIYVEGYHRSVDGMAYLISIIDGKISSGYYSSSMH